jgi:predicted secreted protein
MLTGWRVAGDDDPFDALAGVRSSDVDFSARNLRRTAPKVAGTWKPITMAFH